MTREEIIEAMARTSYENGRAPNFMMPWEAEAVEYRDIHITDMRCAFDALEVIIPGLSDLLEGKAVLVPVELTGAMKVAVRDCDMLNHHESVGQVVVAWPLLVAASPYARKT
jgi:hypothetical protein